jgi:hypothetical protein
MSSLIGLLILVTKIIKKSESREDGKDRKTEDRFCVMAGSRCTAQQVKNVPVHSETQGTGWNSEKSSQGTKNAVSASVTRFFIIYWFKKHEKY